jgi:serine acetyltransferase
MGNKKMISASAIIYKPNIKIANTVEIGDFTIINKKGIDIKKNETTVIGKKCTIGSYVIIYEAVTIKNNTQIEDFCRVGEKTTIGRYCRIIYGAKIYGNVCIGNNCVIGGFICEDVIIGNNCRVFGELVHKYKVHPKDFKNMKKWDEGGEKAPIIKDNVFIGFGAKIIGDITINKGAYIFPNAIVNNDVPANKAIRNINEIHKHPFT